MAPLTASAQTVKQPVVVDANGKVVGPLVGLNAVVLSYESTLFVAPFHRHGFNIDADKNFSGLSQDSTIYYFSADCSGDQYMRAGPIPSIAIVRSGAFVFASSNVVHNMSQSRQKGPNAPCKAEVEFGDFGLIESRPIRRFNFQTPLTVVLR